MENFRFEIIVSHWQYPRSETRPLFRIVPNNRVLDISHLSHLFIQRCLSRCNDGHRLNLQQRRRWHPSSSSFSSSPSPSHRLPISIARRCRHQSIKRHRHFPDLSESRVPANQTQNLIRRKRETKDGLHIHEEQQHNQQQQHELRRCSKAATRTSTLTRFRTANDGHQRPSFVKSIFTSTICRRRIP
ncbi:hypothetical protein BC829DRAFT_174862 [Chytridium lagenaria]|nr:hypothetical protein BC829DRAFT_174862 [Chytridium lagenaria]